AVNRSWLAPSNAGFQAFNRRFLPRPPEHLLNPRTPHLGTECGGSTAPKPFPLQLPPIFVIGFGRSRGKRGKIDAKAGTLPCAIADLWSGLGRAGQACHQICHQGSSRRIEEDRSEAGEA